MPQDLDFWRRSVTRSHALPYPVQPLPAWAPWIRDVKFVNQGLVSDWWAGCGAGVYTGGAECQSNARWRFPASQACRVPREQWVGSARAMRHHLHLGCEYVISSSTGGGTILVTSFSVCSNSILSYFDRLNEKIVFFFLLSQVATFVGLGGLHLVLYSGLKVGISCSNLQLLFLLETWFVWEHVIAVWWGRHFLQARLCFVILGKMAAT
jgi:hypothetical protein